MDKVLPHYLKTFLNTEGDERQLIPYYCSATHDEKMFSKPWKAQSNPISQLAHQNTKLTKYSGLSTTPHLHPTVIVMQK